MSFSFPFWLVLIPYCIAIIIVAIMATLALHHLNSYGASMWVSSFVTFVYLVGTVLIIMASVQMLQGVDWAAPLSFTPSLGNPPPLFDTNSTLP